MEAIAFVQMWQLFETMHKLIPKQPTIDPKLTQSQFKKSSVKP